MKEQRFLAQPWGVLILASMLSFAFAAISRSSGLFGDTVIGILIGTGLTLFATGLSECIRYYRSTSTLEIKPDIEPFGSKNCRISLLVKNEGSVIVKDVKAVLDVLEPEPEELKSLLSKYEEYLVNRDNPRIIGELLPWATPEKIIQRPSVDPTKPYACMEYTHITSIAPYQVVRLLLLSLKGYANAIELRIFSEYGAPGPKYDPTPRPSRVILTLPLQQNLTFKLRVTIASEGLREPHIVELSLSNKLFINILEMIEKGKVKEAINELSKHMRLLK